MNVTRKILPSSIEGSFASGDLSKVFTPVAYDDPDVVRLHYAIFTERWDTLREEDQFLLLADLQKRVRIANEASVFQVTEGSETPVLNP